MKNPYIISVIISSIIASTCFANSNILNSVGAPAYTEIVPTRAPLQRYTKQHGPANLASLSLIRGCRSSGS